jgi:hypothetical protein
MDAENCIFYDEYDKIFLLKDKYRGLRVRIALETQSLRLRAPDDFPWGHTT